MSLSLGIILATCICMAASLTSSANGKALPYSSFIPCVSTPGAKNKVLLIKAEKQRETEQDPRHPQE